MESETGQHIPRAKRQSSFFNIAGSLRTIGVNDSNSKKGSDRTSIRRVNIFNNSKANKITKRYYRLKVAQRLDPNDAENSEDNETIEVEKVDPEDTEVVEIHMRDSLIKSFMVIFTNEKS